MALLQEFDKSLIVQSRWPNLMKYVKGKDGKYPVYVVSDIPSKKKNTGVITLMSETSTPKDCIEFRSFLLIGKVDTEMRTVKIDPKYFEAVAIQLAPHLAAKPKKPKGRPIKYGLKEHRQVIAMSDSGESIRAIARELHMSTFTVQKILKEKDWI